jgi:nucleoside-diphosphate-sugar epimerase
MIFIVGGNGFVGSAFARYCVEHGIDHAVISRENYREFVGRRCEFLVNANGNSKKFRAQERPLEEFDESVRSVRASLVDFHADCYVCLSSCDVYADCSSPQTTAEDGRVDVVAQSPYGFHKYLAEQCVRHAGERWLILRLGGLVGTGMRKNAIFDILQGGPLRLDPASELQYLSTDDAARLAFELFDRGLHGQIFNVCGNGLISLKEVIDAVGHPVDVLPGSPRVRYCVAVDKLARIVPIPETRRTVLEFLQAWLKTSGKQQRELLTDDHFTDALAH